MDIYDVIQTLLFSRLIQMKDAVGVTNRARWTTLKQSKKKVILRVSISSQRD